MKNDKTFEWLKETFEKGKLEVSKLTRISKIRIEIASLTKKKDERLKLLGKKVVALLDEGELVEEELMGEYETIKEIDAKIDELNELVEEIKAKKYEEKKEEVEDLEEDIEYETEMEERVEEEKGQIEETQIGEEKSKEFEETEEEKKEKVNKDNE